MILTGVHRLFLTAAKKMPVLPDLCKKYHNYGNAAHKSWLRPLAELCAVLPYAA